MSRIEFMSDGNLEEIEDYMRKGEVVAKVAKKKEASKQLIAKIYFSRTQEGYLKKYGNDNQYINELAELMNKICKKKLGRIIEEVKQNNTVFRKYLENKHISKLKIEDVVQFEASLETEAKRGLEQPSNVRTENSNIRHLNNDIIKIGFMMILEKLSDEKLNGFISEGKYLKEILEREDHNLKRLGYDYLGVQHSQKARNILEEIQSQEKLNGSFHLISGKIREETATISQVSNCLKSIIEK